MFVQSTMHTCFNWQITFRIIQRNSGASIVSKPRSENLFLAIKKDVNSNSLVTDTLEKANLFNNYF